MPAIPRPTITLNVFKVDHPPETLFETGKH
jgi:hypothetical protein